MAERIYRYEVPVDGRPHRIEFMPGRSADIGPLYVAVRASVVEFWAAHDDDGVPLRATFQVFGTGQDVPSGAIWCGTAPRTPEGLVWHLFELRAVGVAAVAAGRRRS